MKIPTTIFLLLLVAAAIAYIALVERRAPTSDQRDETAFVFGSASHEEVSEIKIVDAAADSRLRLVDDVWEVVEPYKDRADQSLPTRLIDLVAGLEIVDTLPSEEAVASDTPPFDASSREITFKASKDNNLVTLRFGRPAPFEKTVYVKNLGDPDDPRVYVVRADGLDLLTLPPDAYRDADLVSLPAAQIARIRVRNSTGEMSLARAGSGEEARWMLTQPLNTRAESAFVRDRIASLATATVKATTGSTVSSAFDDEATKVSIWGEDQESDADPAVAIQLLAVPDPAAPGAPPEILAKISGRRPLFTVSDPHLLQALTFLPNEIRDRTLGDLNPEAVSTILIRSKADPDVPLFRTGQRWNLIRHGQPEEANNSRVGALIDAINDTLILEFTSDAASDLAPYGLDDPPLTVLFSSAEMETVDGRGTFPVTPENSLTLNIAQGTNRRIYASFAGQPFVYAINPEIFSAIPTDPIKWKSLRVTAFSIFDLRSITRTIGAEPPLTLTFDYTRNTWSATRPGVDLTPALNVPVTETLSAALSAFYADDWITDRGSALDALESPSLRFDIIVARTDYESGESSEETVTLAFAPTSPSPLARQYFGTRSGQPEVFLIRRETYDALSVGLIEEGARQAPTAPTE
ncbi:hypothetical protein BH23VER1_BH23VER1_08170 [soil metagenome]